jgi:hypothetical protein
LRLRRQVGTFIFAAIAWPEGKPKLTWRIRLREASDCTPSVGRPGEGAREPGSAINTLEILVSICLFGLWLPSPKSKKVYQSTNRRGARKPSRRSRESRLSRPSRRSREFGDPRRVSSAPRVESTA